MDDSLNHPDIVALLDNLTYDNWFDMLHPISDRLRELGDDAKADRCIDLIVERKRPRKGPGWFWWLARLTTSFVPTDREVYLWYPTVKYIDKLNNSETTPNIQPQLTGYLLVPEELRIRRSQ